MEPRSPTLQADSLLSEPPGKSKNTGVGGLSLLQGIFLTQESNWSPALRWILYQLNYQEVLDINVPKKAHLKTNMWRKKVTELKGEMDNSPITFGD